MDNRKPDKSVIETAREACDGKLDEIPEFLSLWVRDLQELVDKERRQKQELAAHAQSIVKELNECKKQVKQLEYELSVQKRFSERG